MKEAEVLAYLQQNPDFLLQYGTQLGVRVAAGNVQSFAQAQWLAQQEKTAKMARQLADMLQQSADNFVISERMMRFAARLMAANTLLQVFKAASGSLKDDFALPAHAICLVDAPRKQTAVPPECVLSSNAARAAVRQQKTIICGANLPAALRSLLPQQGKGLESFLCLPLCDNESTVRGVMVAGDADEQRFVADMPTDRVAELAHLTSVALARVGGW